MKCAQSFLRGFLYEIDFFKVPFQFRFKNRLKSSTGLGSFFSTIIIGIVFYLFFSSKMLLKIDPTILNQVITESHAERIELTPQIFQMAASVADSFGKGFNDPTIFKIQFHQIEISFNETLKSKQITKNEKKNTVNCSESNFIDDDPFKNLVLDKYTCIKNETFVIEGGFDENLVKSMVVMIAYCDNKTDGVVCKSQEEINSFFKDKGLWLYYQDDIYDFSNYNHPLKKNWRLQTVQVSQVPRITNIYIKKLIFIDDDHFLFSNEKFRYGFMKESTESLSHLEIIDSPLISINFFSSKNIQKAKRNYQKLGELLANIGGYLNLLIILGIGFSNLENRLQIQNKIMNSIYSYSYEKKIKKSKSKDLKKEIKIKMKIKH